MTWREWVAGKLLDWDILYVRREMVRAEQFEENALVWQRAAIAARDRAGAAEQEARGCRLFAGALLLAHGEEEVAVTYDMMEKARDCVIQRYDPVGERKVIFRLQPRVERKAGLP